MDSLVVAIALVAIVPAALAGGFCLVTFFVPDPLEVLVEADTNEDSTGSSSTTYLLL